MDWSDMPLLSGINLKELPIFVWIKIFISLITLGDWGSIWSFLLNSSVGSYYLDYQMEKISKHVIDLQIRLNLLYEGNIFPKHKLYLRRKWVNVLKCRMCSYFSQNHFRNLMHLSVSILVIYLYIIPWKIKFAKDCVFM